MQLFKKKAYTLYYENECLNCIEHDVTIGTQTWTGCNLSVTTYRNGDTIPQVTDPAAWESLTTGAWCHYNNDPANDAIYGKLYNWYAVNDPRVLAPTGYHVPSDAEWTTLTTFLGGDTVAGGKLKEVGLCHWLSPNTDATDQVLFTALPGGARNFLGTSTNIGVAGNWWSSSEANTTSAIYVNMTYNFANIVSPANSKEYGFSVRLIQDEILSCLTIEVYPPILNPGTSHVVEYLDCDGISQIVTVPDGGTMVTICATEITANNLNGLTQPLYTLCSPPEPLVCSTYSVDPGVGTIEVEGYIGYNIVNYLDCAGDPQTISVSAYQSAQEICASAITGGNNGAGAVLVSTGTCTEPVFFDLTQICAGLEVDITIENVRGGAGGYQVSTSTFATEALALANTSWEPVSTATYTVTESPTEYWISVRDVNGNIGTNFIFAVDCVTPPEPPEFDFTLSQTCSGLDITLVANNIVGGTGPYQFSTTTFSNMTDALDNTTWATASSSKNYPLGNVPGTYWVSIKDSLGMITASGVQADCWDSVNATRTSADLSANSYFSSAGACGSSSTQNIYIAYRNPGILSNGDRVFTTASGNTPFNGMVVSELDNWWKFNDPGTYSACVLGTAVRIDNAGYITDVSCC